MASAQENEAVMRRGYDLFNSGNMDALAQLFADAVVWHAGGRGRFAGAKRGRDSAFAYFGQIAEATGGTFRAALHDVTANAEHAVGLHTNTGQRKGKQLNLHEALLFHVRDGKIIEAWEHYADTQTWDEFFAWRAPAGPRRPARIVQGAACSTSCQTNDHPFRSLRGRIALQSL